MSTLESDKTETKRETTIFVNTVPKKVHGKEISYEEILRLEYGDDVPSGENVNVLVTYKKGPGDKHEGSLVAGQSVKIKEGMAFSVQRPDKS